MFDAVHNRRDHQELVLGRHFAAVTDRGKKHSDNQDYVSIAETKIGSNSAQIAVVCDGVSSSQHAAEASKKGAVAAADSLVRLLQARVDVKDAMKLSLVVADMAVRKLGFDPKDELHPPGATIVASVVLKGLLTVGWIGDSRCYLIDYSGVHLITKDHSWINMVVDAGSLTLDAAEKQPDAHRILRCIGPIFEQMSRGEQQVDVNQVKATSPCRVLLCTDGLWNYLYKPEILPKMLTVGPNAPHCLAQAQNLINFACGQGGKDNITVAVLACE